MQKGFTFWILDIKKQQLTVKANVDKSHLSRQLKAVKIISKC